MNVNESPEVDSNLFIPNVYLEFIFTTGYGEVSVDTRFGKIFSVSFAFLGIPLMFITAADIGKFLSETLTKLKDQGKRFKRKLGVSSFFVSYFRVCESVTGVLQSG